ncbi:Abi family protein [Curtobacterium sp. MCSS17_015]|uniref:Abi family protein n=1 Tax=Curtobacterium sp. MCSS17_015 TaxID=2175666 RepID=UPI000DA8A18B|nr:Abi family protein [Curtobacterium sp. MCSS17_015]WIB26377.1 Abi family protein [Curtobacterium sp. MCSS17_015]
MLHHPLAVSRYRHEQFRQALRAHDLPASDADVDRLHEFDGQLRIVLLSLVERIELALRGRLDEAGIDSAGPFWHLDPRSFRQHAPHGVLRARFSQALARSHDPDLRDRSLDEVPFAVLAEELSLGTLSRTAGALVLRVQGGVARSFRTPQPTFRATVQHITHVRNCCAHHAQVWGRPLGVPTPHYRQPTDLVERLAGAPVRSPYRSAVLIDHLAGTTRRSCPRSYGLTDLLAAHPDLLDGLRHPVGQRRSDEGAG